jgi:hypothetical protein
MHSLLKTKTTEKRSECHSPMETQMSVKRQKTSLDSSFSSFSSSLSTPSSLSSTDTVSASLPPLPPSIPPLPPLPDLKNQTDPTPQETQEAHKKYLLFRQQTIRQNLLDIQEEIDRIYRINAQYDIDFHYETDPTLMVVDFISDLYYDELKLHVMRKRQLKMEWMSVQQSLYKLDPSLVEVVTSTPSVPPPPPPPLPGLSFFSVVFAFFLTFLFSLSQTQSNSKKMKSLRIPSLLDPFSTRFFPRLLLPLHLFRLRFNNLYKIL